MRRSFEAALFQGGGCGAASEGRAAARLLRPRCLPGPCPFARPRPDAPRTDSLPPALTGPSRPAAPPPYPSSLVLAQNKKELLTNWWTEGKLEASEELGDLVSTAGDKDMALKIYQACNASGKVGRGVGGGGVEDHRERGAVR